MVGERKDRQKTQSNIKEERKRECVRAREYDSVASLGGREQALALAGTREEPCCWAVALVAHNPAVPPACKGYSCRNHP